MNEPGQSDPASDPADEHLLTRAPYATPWIDRVRRRLLWLVPLVPLAAVLLAGLPFGNWRTVPGVLYSTDPLTLVPGMRLGLEPISAVVPRLLTTVVFAALIGALTWIGRAGTPGFGFFASIAAFSLSLSIELARWFKPGQLPDFRDPLIAAAVAPIVWRLLRLLPDQPVTPLPRHGPCATRRRILAWYLIAGCAVALIAGAVAVVPAINATGYAPAQIAGRIVALPEGRAGISATVTSAVSGTLEGLGLVGWLRSANRLDHPDRLPLPPWAGAGAAHDGVLPPGRLRSVATSEALRQAIDSAEPGDVILLQPGDYAIRGNYIRFTRAGTDAASITVRSPRLGLVTLKSELPEALKVQAPHWHFENLVLRGMCGRDSDCDNGFHIVGLAEDTVLSNLRIEDFNAQIKINGEDGHFPDRGRIEHTTLIDTHERKTDAPVTPIDLVGANNWLITDNLIADFVKLSGNTVSYGAFAKGDARATVFSRNVVLCEWNLRGPKGQTVGLSFGGGGTGWQTRRDFGRSGYEHADGVMTDNLIAFCSDDGIYVNRSANSVVRHNTLIGTAGIDVRYAESTAVLDGNIIDGPIRVRDDGLFWGSGNVTGSLPEMYLGRNPVRELFVDPPRLDLRWKKIPEMVQPDSGVDLCGAEWTAIAPAGAFQDFRACVEAGKLPSN